MEFSISRIKENLYLGNMFDATNEELLKEKGITHILNVANDVEARVYRTIQVSYKKLNINDGYMNPNFQIELLNNLAWAENALLLEGKLFVHCRAGVNRSAAFVVAILMKVYFMTLKEALAAVERERPINILSINIQVLKQLEKDLLLRRRTARIRDFLRST